MLCSRKITDWIPELVTAYLEEAVSTTRRLPPVRARGYFNLWPDIKYSPGELADQEPRPLMLQATPEAISRLEQVLTWMPLLTVEERKIVWKHAAGIAYKTIGREFGYSETTTRYRWRDAIKKLCSHLNKLGR